MAEAAPARLDGNESALPPSQRVVEAVARALTSANRYPDAHGAALRERLARTFGLAPTQVVLGAGANELIELAAHAFLAPGEEAVFTHPSFICYREAVERVHGTVVAVPGGSGGIEHDLDAMARAIRPNTRLVFVCNPNNPTGALIGAAAWRSFLERVPPHVVVVSDEAYHEFVTDPSYPRTLDDLAAGRRLVLLRTFSKIHSLAGYRIGYALTAPDLAQRLESVRMPFNASLPAQVAALAAVGDTMQVERNRAAATAGRAELAQGLAALGVVTHPSHTNFLLTDFGRDARPIVAGLAARGVLVRGMEPWGMDPRFVRITVGSSDDHRRLFAALEDLLGARGAA